MSSVWGHPVELPDYLSEKKLDHSRPVVVIDEWRILLHLRPRRFGERVVPEVTTFKYSVGRQVE